MCAVGCWMNEVYRHSREFFHSYGDVTIAGEGLQILTYARHLCPLNIEGSLTCHTHCDTGLPFIIMVISEDPCHSHLLPSVWQWSYYYLFLRLRYVATGDRTPISRICEANALSLRHRGGSTMMYFKLQYVRDRKLIVMGTVTLFSNFLIRRL